MEASIVCIGDELLTGDTVNTNAAWLAARLTRRGVKVLRIIVLPDDVEEVAQELCQVAGDLVIVTGGLGPTPDDVTREAVALAAGVPLEESDQARSQLDGKRVPDGPLKTMSRIPGGAEVLPNPVGHAPGFAVGGRIYVLPGVPSEMEAMFLEIESRFIGQPAHVEEVETRIPESSMTEVIEELVRRFPLVKVGSYPGARSVRIRMRSTDAAALAEARAWLEGRLAALASLPGIRLIGGGVHDVGGIGPAKRDKPIGGGSTR